MCQTQIKERERIYNGWQWCLLPAPLNIQKLTTDQWTVHLPRDQCCYNYMETSSFRHHTSNGPVSHLKVKIVHYSFLKNLIFKFQSMSTFMVLSLTSNHCYSLWFGSAAHFPTIEGCFCRWKREKNFWPFSLSLLESPHTVLRVVSSISLNFGAVSWRALLAASQRGELLLQATKPFSFCFLQSY